MGERGASATRCSYWVSDEQLRAFGSRTPDERLRWLDEARAFSIAVAPAKAKLWWKRIKEGR